MTSRRALAVLLLLAGCSSPLGRVRVTVVFENDTRTQCIKASARNESGGAAVNSNPAAIAREGKDTLVIGLGETPDLLGTVSVTVSRFASADCTGTAISSQTKTTEIIHNAPTAMLEFRFGDGAGDGGVDGGVDAGTGDGGADAGCNPSACLNTPGECEVAPATGCASDGGCRFGFLPAQTMCSTGVCNTMGACISNVCAVFDAGATCSDGLDCTPTSQCVSGVCQGTCAQAPECNIVAQPLTCDLVTPTTCALRPTGDFSECGGAGSGKQCLDGGCLPWLPFIPINFVNTLATTPYPSAPWTLSSPDGGICDTIIDTSGSTASLSQGECGSPVLTSTVNDAGVMVITALDLDVGPGARLQFIGSKPVQLVVIGNASIRGVVSVAPLLGGQQPAGTNPAACNAAQAGDANRKGGGGGGFGDNGGAGGESGGAGGTASAMVTPLRGGCVGGAGFRPSGTSPGGTGGGALELIVTGAITMPGGVVTASGGGGTQGLVDNEGAGGGGSGGTVILFATTINLTGGAVTANGGGGGEGGDNAGAGVPGALGPIQSISAAPAADGPTGGGGVGGVGGATGQANGGNGGPGGGSGRGGGGGGGSVGVVYVRSHMSGNCVLGGGLISGYQPVSTNCN
ncbi:MAG: hypothetical protein Q8L48_02375 [Archangium sp.]|nr:hypothetical protein [Archangium sp.]